MHPSRPLGAAAGVAILGSVAFLPFIGTSGEAGQDSLLGIFSAVLPAIGSLQTAGDSLAVALSCIIVISTVLLVVAGCLGVFPLAAGALSVLGMVTISAGPYLVIPGYSIARSSFGLGFDVLWVLSVAILMIGLWRRASKPWEPAAAAAAAAGPAPVHARLK